VASLSGGSCAHVLPRMINKQRFSSSWWPDHGSIPSRSTSWERLGRVARKRPLIFHHPQMDEASRLYGSSSWTRANPRMRRARDLIKLLCGVRVEIVNRARVRVLVVFAVTRTICSHQDNGLRSDREASSRPSADRSARDCIRNGSEDVFGLREGTPRMNDFFRPEISRGGSCASEPELCVRNMWMSIPWCAPRALPLSHGLRAV